MKLKHNHKNTSSYNKNYHQKQIVYNDNPMGKDFYTQEHINTKQKNMES